MSGSELLGLGRDALMLPAVQAGLVLVLGVLVVRLLAVLVQREVTRGQGAHIGLIARKAVAYGGAVVVFLAVAQTLDIDLTALVATAGVATVAIGFAAQTSLSNLIAGLFLLVDRPFKVGDTVEIEGRLGVVLEISLLSTHVRTFDSIQVRWPNEVVLKATILNYTRFPARRIDVRVGVAYGSDLKRARSVLSEAIGGLELVLLEPATEVVTRGLLDSAVELEVRAWVAQPTFLRARTQIIECIHDSLGEAGIEIAFPQLTIWKGVARSEQPASGEPGQPVEEAPAEDSTGR